MGEGKTANYPSGMCDLKTALAQVANVDPCLDLPRDCRDLPKFEGQCQDSQMPPDNHPPCPQPFQEGQIRVACGAYHSNDYQAGKNQARQKLSIACGNPGQNQTQPEPPSSDAGPDRYCYTACIIDSDLNCDPGVIDPLGVNQSPLLVELDPVKSDALIIVFLKDDDDKLYQVWGHIHFAGTLAVDLAPGLRGPFPSDVTPGKSGYAALTYADVHSVDAFSSQGITLDNMVLTPGDTMPGIGYIMAADRTSVTLPPGAPFYAGGVLHIGDDVRRIGQSYLHSSPLIADVNWTTREYTLSGVVQDPQGGSIMAITLAGTIANAPPKAAAGPDMTLECTSPSGASVDLSGAGSWDPDAPDDIASYQWSWMSSSGVRYLNGQTLHTQVPVGEKRFVLTVEDKLGASDSDSVTVRVQDTTPPAVNVESIADSCLWPPDHSMHLFRLGQEILAPVTDACDPNARVRILSVTSNQPDNGLGDGDTPVDVRFGSGAFCLRAERSGTSPDPREYTVLMEARDAHDNVTQTSMIIRVPHDMRYVKCRHGSPTVSVDDPRCVEEVTP